MRKRNSLVESYGVMSMDDEFAILIGDNQKKLQDFLAESEEEKEFQIRSAGLVESKDVDTGETREVLVLISDSGEAWATISPTFIDSFLTMCHWLVTHDMAPKSVLVQKRVGKKGRSFLMCGIGKYEKAKR